MATRLVQNKRQEAKERSRIFRELHFLIQWLEDEDEPLYDVVPARDIRVPEGSEVVNLAPGDKCRATFDNNLYNAEVVATGKYADMKREQVKKDKDAEMTAADVESQSTPYLAEGGIDSSQKESTSHTKLSGSGVQKGGKKNGKTSGSQTMESKKFSKGDGSKKNGERTKNKRMESKMSELGERDGQKSSKESQKTESKKSCLVQRGDKEIQNKQKIKSSQELSTSQRGKESQKTPKKASQALSSGNESQKTPKKASQELSRGKESQKTPKKASQELSSSQRGKKSQKAGHKKSNKELSSGEKASCMEESDHEMGEEYGSQPHYPNVSTPSSEPYKKDKKSPRKRLLASTTDSSDSASNHSDNDYPNNKRPRIQLSSPRKKPWQHSSHEVSGSEEERSLEATRKHNIAQNELFKSMIGLTPGIPSRTVVGEVTKLKEKMRVLERAHFSLKRRVAEQALEIKHLSKITSSAELSSASEAATPIPDYSPPSFTFTQPQGPIRRSPSFGVKPKLETTPDFLKGVEPVKLANAKFQNDPGTAALKLMDCVFTTEEMVNGNPSGVTKSKDVARQQTIRPLSQEKMKYIDDFLREKWGVTTADKTIRKRMTQKCTDYFTDSRYRHLHSTI